MLETISQKSFHIEELSALQIGWKIDFTQLGSAQQEFAAWSGNNMARTCINRHQGFLNAAFMDFSVRKIGLKEMWTLNWHRQFDTSGPWTKAGGVQASSWPDWINRFKDYY